MAYVEPIFPHDERAVGLCWPILAYVVPMLGQLQNLGYGGRWKKRENFSDFSEKSLRHAHAGEQRSGFVQWLVLKIGESKD